MEALRIVALSMLAAVVYGILHDQITARVCVEYFTIGHPRLIESASPTLLGLFWGVAATWWVGLVLGVPLAIAARAGTRPKRDVCSHAWPILELAVVIMVLAVAAGMTGAMLASWGDVFLTEPLASRVPKERHVTFLAVVWPHIASYVFGFIGGFALIVHTWWSRSKTRGEG
jgi:hypothetical protein